MRKHTPAWLWLSVGLLSCSLERAPGGPSSQASPALLARDEQSQPQGRPLSNQANADAAGWTYLGANEATCACHEETLAQWRGTGHPLAYERLVEAGARQSPACLPCHTLGWRTAWDAHEQPAWGKSSGGYDDFWPPREAADDARLEELEGVQCESCHGPAGPLQTALPGDAPDPHAHHAPAVSLATRFVDGKSLSPCGTCHPEALQEWHEGAHGSYLDRTGMSVEDFTFEWGRMTCWSCHSAEGFIAGHDTDYAGVVPFEFQTIDLVGCVACHDPHDATHPSQLRTLADVSVLYSVSQPATFSGYGTSQVCVQCHRARRDVANVNQQIFGSAFIRGPHEGPQMDIFLGTGCYEIAGYTYARTTPHQQLANPCVYCHLLRPAPEGGQRVDHGMAASLTACQPCHVGLSSFDVNGEQTGIANRLEQVLALLMPELPAADRPDSLGSYAYTIGWNAPRRMAAYAYHFVDMDGSLGVHNPAYARSLLDNAIDHLENQ